jgi:hypothetical protein
VAATGEGESEHVGERIGEHFVAERFADTKSEDVWQTSRRIVVLLLHFVFQKLGQESKLATTKVL